MDSQKNNLSQFSSHVPYVLNNGFQAVLLKKSKEKSLIEQETFFDKLKKTWVGKIYVGKLKKYAWARKTVWFLYPKLHACLVRYNQTRSRFHFRLAKNTTPYFSVVSQQELSQEKKTRLFSSEPINSSPPQFFPKAKSPVDKESTEALNFPEIYVNELENILVLGGSNWVFDKKNKQAIHHDLLKLNKDFTSEELHSKFFLNKQFNKLGLLIPYPTDPINIPLAASFLDACAQNYAHWMTEVLPKIAVFCSQAQWNDVPLLIDADLHANLYESLLYVVGEHRTIFLVKRNQFVQVDHLLLTSVCGYVPFDCREKSVCPSSDGLFSPTALQILRNQILSQIDLSIQKFGRNLFIKRNSSLRNVVNSQEIEALLVKHGFEIVEPEKLSFTEQISMFNQANVVVGATGAAFGNVIFASASTQVVILISEQIGTFYNYWQNIAQTSGNKINYVLGKALKSQKDKGIHADFHVDLNDLHHVLKEIFDAKRP